ncbi:MAG: SIS domain-containing protein [Parvibaculaceae bacterium]
MSQSYLDEIGEQPSALRRLSGLITAELAAETDRIRKAIEGRAIRHIVLTGMGGSLYSAYGAWLRLSQSLAIPVSLWDASELVQQAPAVLRDGTMVIAVSQSGESVELRRLTEIDRQSTVRISITNTAENSLSRWASLPLATQAGPEQTVSTKTYTTGLAALHILESLLTGRRAGLEAEIDDLAAAVAALIPRFAKEVDAVLDFVGHDAPITFIGRGASYASAMMAALVTAEAAKAPTQALSGGQFRHGPLELVRAGFRSVMFMGDGAVRGLNIKTAADIEAFGGRCLVVEPEDAKTRPSAGIRALRLPRVNVALLPVLEIIPIQLLMVPMAMARGFEPAQFLNGSKVTVIE